MPNFLDLPAELRLRIYEHAFAPIGYVCLFCEAMSTAHSDRWSSSLNGFRRPHWNLYHQNFPVNLLRTCRQVYEEANDIMFENNTFMLAIPGRQHDGPVVIGAPEKAVGKVQNAFIVLGMDDHDASKDRSYQLREMRSLKSLRIAVLAPEPPMFLESGEGNASKGHTYMRELKDLFSVAPVDCALSFGSQAEAEKSLVAQMKIAEAMIPQTFRSGLIELAPERIEQVVRDWRVKPGMPGEDVTCGFHPE